MEVAFFIYSVMLHRKFKNMANFIALPSKFVKSSYLLGKCLIVLGDGFPFYYFVCTNIRSQVARLAQLELEVTM